ncbi:uncharacterized [Tachysurus ichikawai]
MCFYELVYTHMCTKSAGYLCTRICEAVGRLCRSSTAHFQTSCKLTDSPEMETTAGRNPGGSCLVSQHFEASWSYLEPMRPALFSSSEAAVSVTTCSYNRSDDRCGRYE